MKEIILFLLAVVGVISIACSYALITLGNLVDEFPLGDETTRTRGISSPAETTKIAVILFWIMFLPGAWAVLQDGVVLIIVGITVLFAICLFMLTAMVFSFAVLGTMSRRKDKDNDAVIEVSTPHPALSASSSPAPAEPVVNTTPRKNTLSKDMIHTLLKK